MEYVSIESIRDFGWRKGIADSIERVAIEKLKKKVGFVSVTPMDLQNDKNGRDYKCVTREGKIYIVQKKIRFGRDDLEIFTWKVGCDSGLIVEGRDWTALKTHQTKLHCMSTVWEGVVPKWYTEGHFVHLKSIFLFSSIAVLKMVQELQQEWESAKMKEVWIDGKKIQIYPYNFFKNAQPETISYWKNEVNKPEEVFRNTSGHSIWWKRNNGKGDSCKEGYGKFLFFFPPLSIPSVECILEETERDKLPCRLAPSFH